MTNASQPPFPSRRELRAAQRAAKADAKPSDDLTAHEQPQDAAAGADGSHETGASAVTVPAPHINDAPTNTSEQSLPATETADHANSATTSESVVGQVHSRHRLRERGGWRDAKRAGPKHTSSKHGEPRESFSLTLKPSKKSDGLPAKTPGQRLLSVGTLIAAPLLLVGVSMPANLFYGSDQLTPAIANEAPRTLAVEDSSQPFVASSSVASVEGIRRESWSVTSYAEVLRAKYGGRALSYETSGQGPVRWPFPVAVQISSGFGARVAPCRYCSSYHRGVDFVPGRGAPIYAIADGVVTQQEFSGGYGEHAYIEHTINGQTVLSVYAHMESGSSPLDVGDRVEVGDFVGLVGNTGISTGPHLHFEVRIDGVYLDPFAYLQANAS